MIKSITKLYEFYINKYFILEKTYIIHESIKLNFDIDKS